MNNLKKAYELGWIQASKWAEREDLIADIGSPAYVREADAALADQQPQVALKQPQAEPLESLLSTATGLLIGYEDSDGQGARKPYKPGSAIANFVGECVERLKDWPATASTQQSQATTQRAGAANQERHAMTTTPTGGEAGLPEALRSIQRFEVVDCIDDKHVPAVIPKPHGPWVRYEDHIAALAAGQATAAQPVVPAEWPTNEMIDAGRKAAASQGRLLGSGQSLWHVFRAMLAAAPAQPAAQQGVAYAALPDEGEPWRGHKFKEVQLGCWRCDCGKTIKEVTSDQSTPASGGNYPVMPKRYTVDDDGEELFTAEKMRAFADATHTLRASHGQAPAQPDQPIACSYGDNGYACCEGGPCQADVHNDKLAEQQAPAGAQADSVQEDAARYRWLRERSSTMFVNVSINGDGAEIAETLDSAVDAARKQGEKQ